MDAISISLHNLEIKEFPESTLNAEDSLLNEKKSSHKLLNPFEESISKIIPVCKDV